MYVWSPLERRKDPVECKKGENLKRVLTYVTTGREVSLHMNILVYGYGTNPIFTTCNGRFSHGFGVSVIVKLPNNILAGLAVSKFGFPAVCI